MLLSVVITVRNEGRNIGPLLESLVIQEQPVEILVVDAFSMDNTRPIVRRFAKEYDFIHLVVRGGTRGRSRNYGVGASKGQAVVFIDGDCIASPFWLKHLRARLSAGDAVVAGQSIQIGYRPFEELERVELYYQGSDVTYPSSNLAYRREVFDAVGGFDERFVTAEDIDLNLRAVDTGISIAYEPRAVVYHRTRASYYDFFRQAFWNGVGRKQLTLKHGRLWGSYRPLEMVKRDHDIWSLARLGLALTGYAAYKFFGRSLAGASPSSIEELGGKPAPESLEPAPAGKRF